MSAALYIAGPCANYVKVKKPLALSISEVAFPLGMQRPFHPMHVNVKKLKKISSCTRNLPVFLVGCLNSVNSRREYMNLATMLYRK